MPRIRRLKNYDTIRTDEYEEQDTECSNNGGNNRNSGDQGISDKGWYSKENIISSLSDTKLLQSINYHRETICFLEAELRARNTGLKCHVKNNGKLSIKGLRQIGPHEEIYIGTRNTYIRGNRTKDTTIKNVVKKLKLSPKKQGELLRVWQEILNKGA